MDRPPPADLDAQMNGMLQELEQAKRVQARTHAELIAFGLSNVALFVGLMPWASRRGWLVAMALCFLSVGAIVAWGQARRLAAMARGGSARSRPLGGKWHSAVG